MKYVKKILGISFFSLLPLSAEAESYCNLLWANNTLPSASVNVSFDGNTSGIFPLNLQAGGLSTVIKRAAKNMDTFVTLDGTYRYWIQYPEAWQTTPDGLKYRITSETGGFGHSNCRCQNSCNVCRLPYMGKYIRMQGCRGNL